MNTSRFPHLLTAIAVVLALFPSATVAAAQKIDTNPPPQGDYVPGEVVILFDSNLPQGSASIQAGNLAISAGGKLVRQNGDMALLSFAPDADVMDLSAKLSLQPGVLYAGPNVVSTAAVSTTPGDSPTQPETFNLPTLSVDRDGQKAESVTTLSREQLLGMRTTKSVSGRTVVAPQYDTEIAREWGYIRIGGLIVAPDKTPSPVVCILSTGVDANHPDLKGRVIKGYDFVKMDGNPEDDNGFGTHLAGIIAAKGGNGSNTALGISNGKILAVKVLSASGLGNSYDIAAGINYCANRTDVKVILLSMTGRVYNNGLEYQALTNAVNNKGKLVVAPAGEQGLNYYPNIAYWAYDSSFHSGTISVAGSRRYSTWVDTTGDGIQQNYELFEDCAIWNSNYGTSVEMVAPGYSIYSTTPTYETYLSYHGNLSRSYGYLTGSAQAAAQVAAAAARVWSLNPNDGNDAIEARLLNQSEPLNLASDPNTSLNNAAFSGGFKGSSPFCWPKQYGPFTPWEDMKYSRFLNLAKAMNRGAWKTAVWDAHTGLPLYGAVVRAIGDYGKIYNSAVVGNSPDGAPYLIIPNLPTEKGLKLQVQAKGRTAGFQTFSLYPNPVNAGYVSLSPTDFISVPYGKDFQVVADWHWAEDPLHYHHDFDLFVWLPGGAVNPLNQYNGGVVGTNAIPNWDSLQANFPGNLYHFPYARAWRDGGDYYNSNKNGVDKTQSEVISITSKPGTNRPYFDGVGKGGPNRIEIDAYYNVLMHAPDPQSFNSDWPIITIWYKGAIQAIWPGTEYCDTNQTWWWAGYFYQENGAMKYQEYDQCDWIVPY